MAYLPYRSCFDWSGIPVPSWFHSVGNAGCTFTPMPLIYVLLFALSFQISPGPESSLATSSNQV